MTGLQPFFETLKNTLTTAWPMLSLFVVILSVMKISQIIINKEKIVFYKEFYDLLMIIYILLLYQMLLSTENASSGINLIPFKEITRYSIASTLFLYNVIGNIALFIPFGYFVSEKLKAKKTLHIIIVASIISLTAELIQYKIGRAFDIDDILLNVTGAIIGYIFYTSIQIIKRKLPKFLQNNIFYNILSVIVFLILILLFGSMWGINL